jgi:gamma-F420-2:alpha-L-glutamate ligase
VSLMKTGWLLYDKRDYDVNRMFPAHMRKAAAPINLALRVVLTERFVEALCNPPDFVISRQRNPLLSARLEDMGIPVFNSSRVCEICNDKRETHRFLNGLPLMKTTFLEPGEPYAPDAGDFPLVIKPAFGHGGDRVALAENQAQLDSALTAIDPLPALAQQAASEAGRDLRIYVLFGEIVAAVMRTAESGIVSNYKRGGSVALHTASPMERALAEKVIRRFASSGAPLSFAGIDLLYHRGEPVVNEVEDVVGSRMLYSVGGPDVISMYVRRIADRLKHDIPADL